MRMIPVLISAALLLQAAAVQAGGFQTGQRQRGFSGDRTETIIDGHRDVSSLVESRVSWRGVGSSERLIDDLLIDLKGLRSRVLANDQGVELEDGFDDPTIRVRQDSSSSFSGFRINGDELTRVNSRIVDRYRSVDRLQDNGQDSGTFVSSF